MNQYTEVKEITTLNGELCLKFYHNGNPRDEYFIVPAQPFQIIIAGEAFTYDDNQLIK